ncbi:MAG: tetratricopeptide repeat protein [Acidobacteriota bacterium]|nr:tetratricopeptide repeat protein [Acidobacteriota bacterium]
MKRKSLLVLLFSIAIFGFAFADAAQAQPAYQKIADETIAYVKAGTFGKPSVIKKTGKVALAHVRIHFKFITTQAVETRTNSAKATVYLDGAMTDADLQALTDEFHQMLRQKLAAIGIESIDWQAIQATEYYKNREAATEEKKRTNGDAQNGQAWLSYTAFDGPVFYRYNPVTNAPDELFAYGKMKKIMKMSEDLAAEIMMLDAVVDFSSINLQTNVGTIWKDDGAYTNYQAEQKITAILSVPGSLSYFFNSKGGFDTYNSKLPVAVRQNFASRLYEDQNKAALKTRTFFGDTRFTFTPVVVDADRQLYLAAARRVLAQYADLYVEKMRQLRAGEKPGDAKTIAQNKPVDNTSLQQVKTEARKNNDTTPVTTGEITAALEQAIKEQKFQLAADYYGELIKLNPDEPEHYVNRGVLYLNELKNFKAAAADFTKAIEMKMNNPIILYNRGTAYLHLNDWKKSIKDFDAFLAAQPEHVAGYLNRGLALLNVRKTDEAIADFNRGLQLNPRLPNLYRARALAYKIKGENGLAQADELRAAQLEGGR